MKLHGSLVRWLVIAATAAIFVASAVLAGRLRLEEDITALLPDTDPVVRDYREVMTRFRALDALYVDVGLEPDGRGSPEHVVAVAERLHEQLQKSEAFESIFYRVSPRRWSDLLAALGMRKGSLLSADDLSAVADRLDPDEIHRRLAAARRALIEPSGLFLRDQVRQDPLELGSALLAKLERLNREGRRMQVTDGLIWSPDARHVLLIAVPRFPATDTRRSAALLPLVEQFRQEALAQAPAGTVSISYVGGHRAVLENTETIKGDVSRTLTAASVGIAVIGLLFFRRKSSVALMFLPAAAGVAGALAGFAIFAPHISGVAIGCGAALIGIAVDCGIHILYRNENSGGAAANPHRCAWRLLVPLAACSGTTIVALLSLTFSSLPGQRQMGLFGAAAMLCATAFAVTALPYFVPRPSPARQGRALPLAKYCASVLDWRNRHGRLFGTVGILALLAAVIGTSRLRFEGDVTKMNYQSPDSQRAERQVLGVWGELSATSVVVSGKTMEEALQANDRLFETFLALEARGDIRSFSSLAPILPSAATQEANRRRWGEFWSAQRMAEVRANVTRSAAALKFTPDAFQPFFQGLEAPALPVTPADFEGTGLDELLRKHTARDPDGKCFVLSAFCVDHPAALETAAVAIRAGVPGAIVLNKKQFVEHTAALVGHELAHLAWIAAAAVAAVLLILLRRIELVLSTLACVGFAILVTLGALGLIGIPIDLMNSLFIVFVFGMGVDYSIFLLDGALDAFRGHGAHDDVTFGAVVLSAMTTLVGFGALALARHPAVFSIGITGLLGMTSSLAAAVLVMPALTRRLLPNEGRCGTPSLKTLLGAVWAFVYLVGLALLYLLFLRHAVRAWYRKDPAARERLVRRLIHAVAWGLLRYFPYRDSQRVFIGAAPEAFRKPAVIVSNHLSAFDIIVVLALPADQVMVVKPWVWNAPVMGPLVRDAGYILVDQEGPDAFLARGAECLAQGISVMVFPEGSRSPDGRMRRFHKGAFELAIHARADVRPVLLSNTQACIPHGAVWVGDHRSVIRVLARVTPENFDYGQGAVALARHVKDRMRTFEHEDWRIAQTGRAFWHNIRTLYNYQGAYVESYITWKLRLDPICRHIDRFVPEEGLVVDAGCGYGLMANILARKSGRRRLVGVDMDGEKIRVARRASLGCPNATFEQADLLEWDYPAADAAVLVDVLHYWSPENQRRLIAGVCGRLRPGGVLVFRDACASRGWRHRLTVLAERFSTIVARHNLAPEGLCFLEREAYLRAFEACGMRLMEEPANLNPGSNVVMIFRKEG